MGPGLAVLALSIERRSSIGTPAQAVIADHQPSISSVPLRFLILTLRDTLEAQPDWMCSRL